VRKSHKKAWAVTPQERLAELRAAAAIREETMPWYPDEPDTAEDRAEKDALIGMQSWPDEDADDHAG
jgi:hypothetical protein